MEKVYRVTFLEYTNTLRNCVSNGKELPDRAYLSLPHNSRGAVLAKESDLDALWEYGGGFDVLEYVGDLFGTIAPEYLNKKS